MRIGRKKQIAFSLTNNWVLMSNNSSRFRKRLGRMYRGERLGIIIPIEGEELASKGKGKVKKSEKR